MDEKNGKNAPLLLASLSLSLVWSKSREPEDANKRGNQCPLRDPSESQGQAAWAAGKVEGQFSSPSFPVPRTSVSSGRGTCYYRGRPGKLSPLRPGFKLWLGSEGKRLWSRPRLSWASVHVTPIHTQPAVVLAAVPGGSQSRSGGRCRQEPCLHRVCRQPEAVLRRGEHFVSAPRATP